MSEELCSAAGLPLEPSKASTASSAPANGSSAPAKQRPPPIEASASGSLNAGISPTASRTHAPLPSRDNSRLNIAGGGTNLPPGDKPGDPYAILLVIQGDCLLGDQPWSRLSQSSLPPLVRKALAAGLAMIEGQRCVVITTGGPLLTQALMEAVVSGVPGGLDSFGPGRAVEALFKEHSAPYGALFESALLVKALAKRQRANVRFGSVRVFTADCFEAPALRVYRHCFSDWRVLVEGGAGRGGRDDPLDIQARRPPPVASPICPQHCLQ
eukprot:4282036-Prymnesium_polylepis.1